MAAHDWKVAQLSQAARVNPHGQPRVAQLGRATLRHPAAASCIQAFSLNRPSPRIFTLPLPERERPSKVTQASPPVRARAPAIRWTGFQLRRPRLWRLRSLAIRWTGFQLRRPRLWRLRGARWESRCRSRQTSSPVGAAHSRDGCVTLSPPDFGNRITSSRRERCRSIPMRFGYSPCMRSGKARRARGNLAPTTRRQIVAPTTRRQKCGADDPSAKMWRRRPVGMAGWAEAAGWPGERHSTLHPCRGRPCRQPPTRRRYISRPPVAWAISARHGASPHFSHSWRKGRQRVAEADRGVVSN